MDAMLVAQHSFEECSAKTAGVYPTRSVLAQRPYDSRNVSFYMAEMTAYLCPQSVRRHSRLSAGYRASHVENVNVPLNHDVSRAEG